MSGSSATWLSKSLHPVACRTKWLDGDSKMNHPNMQIVRDVDSDRGLDFLVTEYVAGSTLRDLLQEGALPPNEVLELGAQLADGLAAAHARGIVHRDLKPENIKVTP